MSAGGMRSPRLSEYRVGSLRVAVVVAVVTSLAALGAARPASVEAQTANAPKGIAQAPTLKKSKRSAQHPKRLKQHRTATHIQTPSRVARRPAHRAPSRKAPVSHASARKPAHRSARAHHKRRPAASPAQARDQFTVPQGDGLPVLAYAARLLGRPYRFGSEQGAFDCSGFVRSVFAKVGVELPHSAREQFALGDRVTRDDLEPGDLVFFRTYRRYATHVGIYVGENKFVHAATRGGQVQVDSLSEDYYAHHYLGARRIEI